MHTGQLDLLQLAHCFLGGKLKETFRRWQNARDAMQWLVWMLVPQNKRHFE